MGISHAKSDIYSYDGTQVIRGFDTISATTLTDGTIIITGGSFAGINTLTATTGDISTLHSDTLTASDLTATTGDIDTLHVDTLTASSLVATYIESINATIGEIYINKSDGVILGSPMWDDLRMPVTSLSKGGVKDPDFAAFRNGAYTYLFDSAVVEELFFTAQMPHTYEEGTDYGFHIHWSPTTTATGFVGWQLEYTVCNVNATFPSTITINATDYTDGTQYKHRLIEFGNLSGSGLTISHMILGRISRNASQTYDTYNDDAALLEADFHYKVNSFGSRQELVK